MEVRIVWDHSNHCRWLVTLWSTETNHVHYLLCVATTDQNVAYTVMITKAKCDYVSQKHFSIVFHYFLIHRLFNICLLSSAISVVHTFKTRYALYPGTVHDSTGYFSFNPNFYARFWWFDFYARFCIQCFPVIHVLIAHVHIFIFACVE